jgi:hypothetical protein
VRLKEEGTVRLKEEGTVRLKEEGTVRLKGMLLVLTARCLPVGLRAECVYVCVRVCMCVCSPVGLRAEPREALAINEGFGGIEAGHADVEP